MYEYAFVYTRFYIDCTKYIDYISIVHRSILFSDFRSGKTRDQQSDDGYYSSSTQHQLLDPLHPSNSHLAAASAYHDVYQEDPFAQGRSPTPRRRSGHRRGSASSDVTGAVSDLSLRTASPNTVRRSGRRDVYK